MTAKAFFLVNGSKFKGPFSPGWVEAAFLMAAQAAVSPEARQRRSEREKSMAKIKWEGIIRDPCVFQKGELPPNARKLLMPETIGGMMVKAIPFLIAPFCILIISMFFKTLFSGGAVISFPFLLLGLGVGFLLLFVHECLHALVYPKGVVVHLGVIPRYFAAVALVSYPISKRRFVVMSLLPAALGVIPMVLFWIMPPGCRALNGFLFGMAVFGMIAPYPDYWNVFQIGRQAPPGCWIQFYEKDVYCFDVNDSL